MTMTQDLIDLVEVLPTCDLYAGLLYDHLLEDRDMTPEEAANHVRHVREPALRGYYLAEATRIVGSRGKYRRRTLDRIMQSVGTPPGLRVTVLVIEGGSAPVIRPNPDGVPDGYWPYVSILVGAAWVIDAHDQVRAQFKAEREVRRASRSTATQHPTTGTSQEESR